MITGTPGATVFTCPLCDWTHESRAPGLSEHPGVLADVFGYGVFAAHAASERIRADEEALREHLSGHKLEEWVGALVRANSRLDALRECAAAPTTAQPIREAVLAILEDR